MHSGANGKNTLDLDKAAEKLDAGLHSMLCCSWQYLQKSVVPSVSKTETLCQEVLSSSLVDGLSSV